MFGIVRANLDHICVAIRVQAICYGTEAIKVSGSLRLIFKQINTSWNTKFQKNYQKLVLSRKIFDISIPPWFQTKNIPSYSRTWTCKFVAVQTLLSG